MTSVPTLREAAQAVLAQNDQGEYTLPAEGLYPHQWLWDSCFIAIGLCHYDTDRAMSEIRSLFKAQWHNGMLPHMVFSQSPKYRRDRNVWRSWLSPEAPDGIATSGISQPPMVAEAVYRIGQSLTLAERRSWYASVLPGLVHYHEWLYADRDPHQEGLVLQIHPYEVGLDNTPPWITQLKQHHLPWWAVALQKTRADTLVNLVRRDTRHVPPGQRISNIDALLYYDAIRRLRRKRYAITAILDRSLFAIEDLTYNAIFIRANRLLQDIAHTAGTPLSDVLLNRMNKTEQALEQLWDPYHAQYFSRDFVTHSLLKQPTLAALLPLYAGTISKERASQLVRLLENDHIFGSTYPVPSVPLNDEYYKPLAYWQGPTWINTNWLIIDGLRRYGYTDHADALTESSLEMVSQHGFYEYFHPETGQGAGAHNFSWTAALCIDLEMQLERAKEVPKTMHDNSSKHNIHKQ